MLNFKGDTMCYIMYGNTRLIKIFENVSKCEIEYTDKINKIEDLTSLNNKDIDLLKFIFKLPEIVELIESTYCIHHICRYLYELIGLFNNLYIYKTNKVIYKNNDIYDINYKRLEILKLCKKNINFVFTILNITELNYM